MGKDDKLRRRIDRIKIYHDACIDNYGQKNVESKLNISECINQVHFLAGKIGVKGDGNQDRLTKELVKNCLERKCSEVEKNIQDLYKSLGN